MPDPEALKPQPGAGRASTPPVGAPRRLCITVDDFGLHEGVDAAVMALAGQGRVQASSCMVGGASFKQSGPALFALAPDAFDVGLHLDLTETPLRRPRDASLSRLILASALRRLDRRALRDEIEAQLDAFEDLAGRPPAYVDGHQHVHQFAQVRDELLAALERRYGAGARPWLRATRAPDGVLGCAALEPAARIKPLIIEALGARALSRMAGRFGFAQNARLLGVYDFRPDPDLYRRLLAAWLGLAGDGDVLMCHPACVSSRADALLAARLNEWAILSSAETAERIQAVAIELTPISRILGRPWAHDANP